jgi:predicted SAM-dependent methyltransferase
MPLVLTAIAGKACRKASELAAHTRFYRHAYPVLHPRKQAYSCPVCGYVGPFRDIATPDTVMRDSMCLACGAMERHRLQHLVMQALCGEMPFHAMSMLHVAPEPCLGRHFSGWFRHYATADLDRTDVVHRVDLRALDFEDGTFDCVYASHVLEHIAEDDRALGEVRRVLTGRGIAVLPVPIVSAATIEYGGAREFGHVRAPGPDYLDKYRNHFARVRVFSSGDFPPEHQLFVYEDRTRWPSKQRPLAAPIDGEKHVDLVPVCYVTG